MIQSRNSILLAIHIVPINSKFNWKFVKLTHPLFGTQVKRTMIMESKSLDLEACVVLLNKKWHRQSIIFFCRLLFLQQVTKCHILWRLSISLPWIEHILTYMMAATTDKSQSICFIFFVIFLETISFYYHMQKKRFDSPANKIKRYDHSMTSRAWIFQWYFHDTYITHKTLFITFAIYQKKYSHEGAKRN